MFKFTSLAGQARQSLIELEGGINILIDVGWDDGFGADVLAELERRAPTLSLVLLTRARASHLAAYVHCCRHVRRFARVPAYATTPVIALGRALARDAYASDPLAPSSPAREALADVFGPDAPLAGGGGERVLLPRPTPDEVERCFRAVRPLRHAEPLQSFSPPLHGLTVTAYHAGHALGGTAWVIQHYAESVVYAADWDQPAEAVLRAAPWCAPVGRDVAEVVRRPTALVCGGRGRGKFAPGSGAGAETGLVVRHLRAAVARGGSVLIPADTCGRALEMAFFLDAAWKTEHGLGGAELYFASGAGTAAMVAAKHLAEWINAEATRKVDAAEVVEEKEAETDDAVNFKHLRIIDSKMQLRKIVSLTGPKVIIATDISLEWGFARYIFEEFCSDEKNLVLLTESTADGNPESLASRLWDMWASKASDGPVNEKALSRDVGTGTRISCRTAEIKPLEGNDLSTYQNYLDTKRQMEDDDQFNLGLDDIFDYSSSSDEEEFDGVGLEQQGKALKVSKTLKRVKNRAELPDEELGVDVLVYREGRHDWHVGGKAGKDAMFPVRPGKRLAKIDDHGEVVNPDDFLLPEQKADMDGQAEQKADFAVGQKRQLIDEAAKNGIKKDMKREPDSDMDEDVKDVKKSDRDEEDDMQKGPSKAIIGSMTLTLNARLAFVDFGGRDHWNRMQAVIKLMRPRNVLLLGGGSSTENEAMRAECEALLASLAAAAAGGSGAPGKADLLVPVPGATLTINDDPGSYMARLSPELLRGLQWQQVGRLRVAPVRAGLRSAPPPPPPPAGGGDSPPSDGDVEGNAVAAKPGIPTLDVLPPAAAAQLARRVPRTLFLGEVHLPELRRQLLERGFKAEYRGEGTLLVNDHVVLKKSAENHIKIEQVIGLPGISVLDPAFDEVKRLIYGSLAVIDGI
jgi:cleavage and polyadenylation specificity factor subunit 2